MSEQNTEPEADSLADYGLSRVEQHLLKGTPLFDE